MAVRSKFTADIAMVLVIWGGIGSFVALHTVLLLRSPNEQIHNMVRLSWFFGLILAALISLSSLLTDSELPTSW